MNLFGIIIFLAIFSVTFTYVNNYLNKQSANNTKNEIIIRSSPFLIATCYSMAAGALGLALMTATIWRNDTLNTTLLLSFLGYAALSYGLGFFYSYGKIIVNPEKIKVIHLLGRNKTFSWNEITQIRYEEGNGLQAFCGRKKAFQCADSFSGFEQLLELLRKKKMVK